MFENDMKSKTWNQKLLISSLTWKCQTFMKSKMTWNQKLLICWTLFLNLKAVFNNFPALLFLSCSPVSIFVFDWPIGFGLLEVFFILFYFFQECSTLGNSIGSSESPEWSENLFWLPGSLLFLSFLIHAATWSCLS